MRNKWLIILLMGLLSGCAAPDFFAAAVNEYCLKGQGERELVRAAVARQVAPHRAVIYCDGEN